MGSVVVSLIYTVRVVGHWVSGLRTVGYHDRVFAGDGFICDSLGEVDCEEDRVLLSAGVVERCFEEDLVELEDAIGW